MSFKPKFNNQASLGSFTSSSAVSYIRASLMHRLMTSHSRHFRIFTGQWQYILLLSLCFMLPVTCLVSVVCVANVSMLCPHGGRVMHNMTVYSLTPTPLLRACTWPRCWLSSFVLFLQSCKKIVPMCTRSLVLTHW